MLRVLRILFTIVASIVLGLIVVLNVTRIPIPASLLVDNPQSYSLRGVDRTQKIRGTLDWSSLRIGMSGLTVTAGATGLFSDADAVFNQIVNPENPVAVVQKRNFKVWQSSPSKLSCSGIAKKIDCQGDIRFQIKLPLGRIKNTLRVSTRSSAEISENQLIFHHQVTGIKDAPSIVDGLLNDALSKRDQSRGLPKFFAKHDIQITEFEFDGNSDAGDLRLNLFFQMHLTDFLKALI